jgi:hypothetical protein
VQKNQIKLRVQLWARIVYSGYVLDSEQFQPLVEPSQSNTWSVTPYFTAAGSKSLSRDFAGNLSARPFFSNNMDLIRETRSIVTRCLTRQQRVRFNLAPEPPAWCIELKKWPYAMPEWRSWLDRVNRGEKVDLPRESVSR